MELFLKDGALCEAKPMGGDGSMCMLPQGWSSFSRMELFVKPSLWEVMAACVCYLKDGALCEARALGGDGSMCERI